MKLLPNGIPDKCAVYNPSETITNTKVWFIAVSTTDLSFGELASIKPPRTRYKTITKMAMPECAFANTYGSMV